MTDLSLPPFGRLAWIDVILLGDWFAATVASVACVAYDAIRNNPEREQGGGGLMMIVEVNP